MRGRILSALGSASVLVLLAGCQSNSGRAIKMQQSSGKMNRDADAPYHAVCKTWTPGGHESTWSGPPWRAKERAMRDAADHEKEHPGHQATIER